MSITISHLARYEPPVLSLSSKYHSAAIDALIDSQGQDDDDIIMTGNSVTSKSSASKKLVTPGEFVTDDPQFMRGHGTYLAPLPSPLGTSTSTLPTKTSTGNGAGMTGEKGNVASTVNAAVMGTITRTNKLLSITPLRTRFTPEIGDLLIGRVTEVLPKKWKLNISSKQDATLQLASINLPGGIQRRKSASDELQMRSFFNEGDLVLSEVQSYFGDGSVSLHTRSLKYGKLRNGQFLELPNSCIVRSKTQTMQIGNVDVILGVNGYCFISKHTAHSLVSSSSTAGNPTSGISTAAGGVSGNIISQEASDAIYSNTNEFISDSIREEITRVRNVLVVLGRSGVRIDVDVVRRGVEGSMVYADVCEILDGRNGERVVGEALFSSDPASGSGNR